MELDMTKGKPLQLIVKFMIPLILGNIFQQFYAMADTVIVGRFVGVNALAAVGATGSISFLLLGFLQGLTAGFTVLTSQRFGAGDIEGMKKTVGNAAVLSVIVTLVGTVLSVVFMSGLLRLMNTPEEIFADALEYITIICMGFAAVILYNMMASILRAIGDSRTPLYFLVLAAGLNVVLDLVFIINFGWGVAGAAWATVISQGVSGILCVIYVIKKVPLLHINREHCRLDGQVVRIQLKIGLPMALQFSITAIGAIIVQSVLNMLGAFAVAAYTAACKVEQLVTQPFVAIGVTMATYCAQNKGVNDYDRIRQGVKISHILSAGYAIISALVVNATIPYILRLFVSAAELPEILKYAEIYVFLCSIFFFPLAMIYILRNALQGSGYSFLPMMGGVVEMVSRVVIAMIAASMMSYTGVCFANGITWLVTAVFLLISYRYTMKKAEKRSMQSA